MFQDNIQVGVKVFPRDLVNVLHDAYQHIETYALFLSDAEMVEFFRRVLDEERQRVERAQHLLTKRL